MLPPYGPLINARLKQISSLGFVLFEDSDYGLVFSKGTQKLTFASEPVYHPSLASNITDDAGIKREIGLLMSVVDPGLHDRMIHDLSDQRATAHFDKRTLKEITLDGSLDRYVNSELDYILDFLDKDGEWAFAMPPEMQSLYRQKEKTLLARFGVKA